MTTGRCEDEVGGARDTRREDETGKGAGCEKKRRQNEWSPRAKRNGRCASNRRTQAFKKMMLRRLCRNRRWERAAHDGRVVRWRSWQEEDEPIRRNRRTTNMKSRSSDDLNKQRMKFWLSGARTWRFTSYRSDDFMKQPINSYHLHRCRHYETHLFTRKTVRGIKQTPNNEIGLGRATLTPGVKALP